MKVVANFYPIDIKGKEDYLKLGADITNGEIVSVMDNNFFSIVKKIFGQDVHAHGRGFPFPEISCLFARKSVYTPHFNNIGSTWYGKFLRRIILNRYTKIIAQTEYGKRNYIHDGIDPKKIVVVPIPIDYDFFSRPKGGKEFRKKHGLTKDEKFALCVGIRKMKNPLVMIDACKKVGIKIVMVGFKDRKEIRHGFEFLLPPKELLEKESDDVILTGFISKEELLAALDTATVYLNSSENGEECFSLVVYEAAAAGVPLCLPDFGVFEIFKNCALFHNNHDSNQLSRNIQKYLDDKELVKKFTKKAKKIAKEFDYPIVRKQFEEFYKKLGMR